jgi:DNA recombination protein RmuC
MLRTGRPPLSSELPLDPLAVAFVIVALAAGLALGWFLGTRPVADWKARHAERDAEAKQHEAQFRQAIAELGQARIEVATLTANAENFDKQIAQLNQAREDLVAQFKAAGGEVLAKAQDEFMKRAEEKFGSAEKTNKEAVAALLEPVNQRLRSYEEQVKALETQRVDAFGQLTGLIQSMRDGQEAVRTAAQQLGNSLRNAPKARGRWGEQQLRNVLEQCGLAEHTDFATEQSVETDEGRLRPDAIVRIPGNKLLVIDAKVSLNAYQEAFEAADDTERTRHLDLHAASMRNHIQTLGAKSYQSQFEEAPDYVLMFVPGEHFIAAALEHDPRLWDFAFERRVLLASPTNLVAICRTVAQVWRQDGLAREAREIGRMGGELYDRLAKVTDDIAKVGTHLGRAVGSYNDFARSFESRVLVSAKRLRDKHIEIGKREIDAVPLVESAPRYGAADEPPTPRLVDTAGDDKARSAG